MAKEKLKELLARGAMTKTDFGCHVVRSTDQQGRVMVSGYTDPDWTDCLSLSFLQEGTKEWRYLHFSPARARLIAKMITERADYLEKHDPGLNCIDKPFGAK